ncbi:hypothetical protein BO82DRAFT_355116 [Aspergillus uvarum CBS 121591]|uniref:Uncharacterized protein n=1 Tax=Aspergillus uvarum CBS 121591 TaxID=1448315 RepID=A0A319CZ37_9EURO|nr:hypothetical protein BO82DRAFT_355116 [Aspergillus uvarum CBS 121591]PYH80888.1 hypothetical protein BO82DRAFT_355116 [Aspergillus uvarum CBS 121591]
MADRFARGLSTARYQQTLRAEAGDRREIRGRQTDAPKRCSSTELLGDIPGAEGRNRRRSHHRKWDWIHAGMTTETQRK